MTESEQLIEIKRIFGLPTQLAAMLQLLLRHDRVTKAGLSNLISTFHGDRPYHNADRMIIYRLRSKMEKHGVVVFSQYGEGYYIKAVDKAIIRDRLAPR
jgi:DNA-binding response OmpR family regulator